MKILLIEDDERKGEQIRTFLKACLPDVSVTLARSYRSGLQSLEDTSLNLIILDMTIPTYDVSAVETGGRPHAFGGRELLHQMLRRGIATPVVVVTQYEKFGEGSRSSTLAELDTELGDTFGSQYLGAIHYSPATDNWKDGLLTVFEDTL